MKARRRKTRTKAATQAEVARHLLLSTSRVAELVAGGVRKPLRLEQCREAYIRHQRETAAGRQRGFRRGTDGSDRAESARAFFDMHILPEEHLIPWQHDQVMTINEYAERIGIGHDVITLIAYGMPFWAPREGEKEGLVSWPHCERWRVLMAATLQLTGVRLDGGAHGELDRLGAELTRAGAVARG